MHVRAKVKIELEVLLGPFNDTLAASYIAKAAREKAREKMMKLLNGTLGDEHHHFSLSRNIDVCEIICTDGEP